jgi:hypothetical protein
MIAVSVAPIPMNCGTSLARVKTSWFARSTAWRSVIPGLIQACSLLMWVFRSDSYATAATVCTVSSLATSPAAAPPIPSATMNSA